MKAQKIHKSFSPCTRLCHCISLIFFFLNLICFQKQILADSSLKEAFKNYLENIPERGELSCLIHTPGGTIHLPNETKIIPPRLIGFKAKWQENDFFLAQTTETNDLENIDIDKITTIVGKYGDVGWTYRSGVLLKYYPSSSREKRKEFEDEERWALGRLRFPLGLGVLIQPGTLKWEGDKFSSLSRVGTMMNGVLTSEFGIPKKMSIAREVSDLHLVFVYKNNTKVDNLPTVIKTEHKYPDGNISEFETITLVSLNALVESENINNFSPESVLINLTNNSSFPPSPTAQLKTTIVFTNNEAFSVHNSKMFAIRDDDSTDVSTTFYLIFATISVISLVAIYRAQKK